ncbi:MAG: hypothetical protein ABIO04_13150 [Ferruginibacter sp.]
MKDLIIVSMLMLWLSACNNQDSQSTNSNDDSNTTTDTAGLITLSPDTIKNRNYVPTEGDVSYQNKKVKVYKDHNYVDVDNDVTLDGGVVVRKNGDVVREGKVRRLEEGESVSRTGNFFNRAGERIDDAWNASKTGVKKAANAVKKTGRKVGEKVKDAVNN